MTSAAAVMFGVFAVFATLQFIDLKELGVGLAAAVLIDATIVRGVLLPASMKVLGDWNWYLPSWLEWLPRMGSETPGPAASARRGARSRGAEQAAEARAGAGLMALIEVEHLTKQLRAGAGGRGPELLDRGGHDRRLPRPERLRKTTTLRSLLGLVTPTSGTATIAGRPYGELEDPLHEVGVMLEASDPPGPQRP